MQNGKKSVLNLRLFKIFNLYFLNTFIIQNIQLRENVEYLITITSKSLANYREQKRKLFHFWVITGNSVRFHSIQTSRFHSIQTSRF